MSANSNLLGLGLIALSQAAFAADKSLKEQPIEFQYTIVVPAVSKDQLPLKVFVPLARSDGQQDIIARDVLGLTPKIQKNVKEARENVYGNEFWEWTITDPIPEPTKISFQYKILRKAFDGQDWKSASKAEYAANGKVPWQQFLKADERVPIEGELISKLRTEIPKSATSPMLKARAIYDYVVDHMEYKKVGEGWGNGDTYWACTQKYGNCTDFHALLTSMSRAEGIPTRFEIGFPIPLDRDKGDIAGYHCWLQLYLPKLAWMPVDASEAKKHPEEREFLFGSQAPDRILFTVGRDLVLPGMESKRPINFFIYPHVEQKGEVKKDLVKTEFSYRLLKNRS